MMCAIMYEIYYMFLTEFDKTRMWLALSEAIRKPVGRTGDYGTNWGVSLGDDKSITCLAVTLMTLGYKTMFTTRYCLRRHSDILCSIHTHTHTHTHTPTSASLFKTSEWCFLQPP